MIGELEVPRSLVGSNDESGDLELALGHRIERLLRNELVTKAQAASELTLLTGSPSTRYLGKSVHACQPGTGSRCSFGHNSQQPAHLKIG